jgi:fructose-1,6-bisphosphatase/sedoheptulose 1,7-bisphosphatase-like protein
VVNNDLELPVEQEGEQPVVAAANNLPQNFAVVVDAANTPQRLQQVLQDLKEAGAKRIFTVFGCDGQVGCLCCEQSGTMAMAMNWGSAVVQQGVACCPHRVSEECLTKS